MMCLIDFNRYNCLLNNDIKVTTSFQHINRHFTQLHTQHRRKALKIMFIILIRMGLLSEYFFFLAFFSTS